MLRKIAAIAIGLFITLLSGAIVQILFFGRSSNVCTHGERQFWIEQIVTFCMPIFIGGLSTGFISRQKGWFFGFVNGILFLLLLLFFSFILISCTPIVEIQDLDFSLLTKDAWLWIMVLIVSTAGGYIGQRLRQLKQKGTKL